MIICEFSIMSVNSLSRKCDSLNISETYGPTRDSFIKLLDSVKRHAILTKDSKNPPPPGLSKHKIKDEKSALTTSFLSSLRPSHQMIYTYAIVKQPNN
jgi:hypothetical protein